ncbi:MAG: Hsp20/alpha crystallin family protein [Promethearchaeota archaeon]|nr:MAG: Hsp20/alpha crystallin family protein [Candidatus Lokiarchaeota archaeon]
MEEAIKEKEKMEVEDVKEEKTAQRIILPRLYICMKNDGSGYTGEAHLPGVDKDSITLKMNEDFLTINGKTKDVEYRRTYWFGCPVEPKSAKSKYKEGLLTFEVEFKEPDLSTIDIDVE